MFMGPLHHLMLRLKFWVGEFKRGRTSLEDEARSGCPLDATDKEMYKKVRDLVYSDRQIHVEEIVQALGISHGCVSFILHDCLGMGRLTVPWGPNCLSHEQMATRASVCSALLKPFRSKDDFLLHLVTVDETLVHYYEPENKAQSSQWVGPGSLRPRKFKTQQSAGKVWDAKGVIIYSILSHNLGRSSGHHRRSSGRSSGHYYVGLFTQEK